MGAAPGKTSRRQRIAHAGVILAQDGSWRFFDRGSVRTMFSGTSTNVFCALRGRMKLSRARAMLFIHELGRAASGAKILAGHFGLGLGIARALGVEGRRISGLWICSGAVQSSKNSSARVQLVVRGKPVLLHEIRELSREQATQINAPHPSHERAGTRYPTPSPPETAAATSRCR